MRPRLLPAAGLAALAALSTLPAAAQVQPGNPNAANESLARQSDMRSMQQGITSQNNAIRMEIQRNEISRPHTPPPGSGAVPAPRR